MVVDLPAGYLLPDGMTMRDVMRNDAEILATEGIPSDVAFPYRTPHHPKGEKLRVKERYPGLQGQMRIALVDKVGRVWHYDEEEVEASDSV